MKSTILYTIASTPQSVDKSWTWILIRVESNIKLKRDIPESNIKRLMLKLQGAFLSTISTHQHSQSITQMCYD